jgi:hypothetical protein
MLEFLQTLKFFQWGNFILFAAHLAQSISLFVLGVRAGVVQSPFIYLASNASQVIASNASSNTSGFYLPYHASPTGVYMNIVLANASFLLITAFFHLISWYRFVWGDYSSVAGDYGTLEAHEFKSYPMRWMEYSITAPLMVFNISMVSGMADPRALTNALGCVYGMIVLGYLSDCFAEEFVVYTPKKYKDETDYTAIGQKAAAARTPKKSNSTKTIVTIGTLSEISHNKMNAWMAYFFGCIVALPPWIGIFISISFLPNSLSYKTNIIWYIAITFVLFFSFAVVSFYRLYNEKYSFEVEWMYMLLSALSKSLLAWGVAAPFFA